VDAGDLLDQVDLARQIAAPGGGHDFHALWIVFQLAVAQRGQNRAGPCRLDFDSQHAFQLVESQHDRFARLRLSTNVDDALGQFAAGQFQDQFAASAAGPIDALGIDAPLETVR
jgi:hypothetical protein